jgi:putative nucleotidyltransferase with HDIG domain
LSGTEKNQGSVLMQDGLESIRDAVERVPALHSSVRTLMRMSGGEVYPRLDLVEAIDSDPVFSLKILRLAKSCFFGMPQEMTSIRQVGVLLGMGMLQSVALGLAVIAAIPSGTSRDMNMGAFWLHSLATATAAGMLARKLGAGHEERGDCFTAGLLHDLGKIVFALFMPDEYRAVMKYAMEPDVDICRAEREILGCDHAQAGELLARHWDLPERICGVIAHHHSPDDVSGSQLLDCVFAADQISKRLSFGTAGNYEVESLPARMEERFGMGLQGIVEDLSGLDEAVDASRIFIKLGGG